VEDIKADRTIVIADSILMMMECKSQYGERKANDQEIDKFSGHQPVEIKLWYLKRKSKFAAR
jgi:hypothetical protein